MKLKIFTLSAMLLLVFSACDKKPQIVFSSTTHNFGKVKIESTLTHTFSFKNTGTATLKIDRIRSGWGCTGTLLSAKEIPAGGSGEIEVEVHLDRHTGEVVKTVQVFTNDPDHAMVKLILKADVSE